MPKTANFITEAIKSALFSLSDIQRISERPSSTRCRPATRPSGLRKTAPRYRIGIRIIEDMATIYLDTSGDGLHDRGYRQRSVKAPLTETLASGLVQLSFWNKDRMSIDPFAAAVRF